MNAFEGLIGVGQYLVTPTETPAELAAKMVRGLRRRGGVGRLHARRPRSTASTPTSCSWPPPSSCARVTTLRTCPRWRASSSTGSSAAGRSRWTRRSSTRWAWTRARVTTGDAPDLRARTTRTSAPGLTPTPICSVSTRGARAPSCTRRRATWLYFVVVDQERPGGLRRDLRRAAGQREARPEERRGMNWRMGVVGYPIEHSLTPRLHETALALVGLEGSSERVALRESEAERLGEMMRSRFDGLSVTMPLKSRGGRGVRRARPHSDRVSAWSTRSCRATVASRARRPTARGSSTRCDAQFGLIAVARQRRGPRRRGSGARHRRRPGARRGAQRARLRARPRRASTGCSSATTASWRGRGPPASWTSSSTPSRSTAAEPAEVVAGATRVDGMRRRHLRAAPDAVAVGPRGPGVSHGQRPGHAGLPGGAPALVVVGPRGRRRGAAQGGRVTDTLSAITSRLRRREGLDYSLLWGMILLGFIGVMMVYSRDARAAHQRRLQPALLPRAPGRLRGPRRRP